MSSDSSEEKSRILRSQSTAEVQRRNALRIFFEYMPVAALIMLVAIVIRAAYHQPSPNQFTSEEASRLKRLAEHSPQKTIPAASSSSQLETATQKGQPPPPQQFSATDAEALKALAANSKQLNRLADNSNDLLNKKLDAEEIARLKEDVQRYLEWIIAIAGIFSIAQTIAAAYTSQSFTRQAERDVKELSEFKKSYEMVARAGQMQQGAFDILESCFGNGGWVDWRRELYGKMNLIDRQLILSADRFLGYDLLLNELHAPGATPSPLQLESGKLRGLANFYTSKYDYEHKLHSGQWQDLERANHLLASWILSHSGDFKLHNDLGLVLIKCADHCQRIPDRDLEFSFRRQARAEFRQSADLRQAQQRAYFNIARIDFDMTKPVGWPDGKAPAPGCPGPTVTVTPEMIEGFKTGLRSAEKAALTALDHTDWETKPNPVMSTEIVYNLACFRALLIFCGVKHDPAARISAEQARPVFEALEKVAGEGGGTILERYVKNDFDEPTGDLYGFKSRLSKLDENRLTDLRPRLSKHAARDE